MPTITADTGLIQPRASQASRPKPRRFKLRNNEAWDRLRAPVTSMLGQYPGLAPSALSALLSAEGHLDWLPRGANAIGVVSRVLQRLEKTRQIVQANGWFLASDAHQDDIADHGSQIAKRGLRTSVNAMIKTRDLGAISGVDRKVRAATKAASDVLF